MEEGQEAAIVGRRSQDSERVRAQLKERAFPPKPDNVRHQDHDAEISGAVLGGQPGRYALQPDGRDTRPGRERPLSDGPWGEERGSQVGVAHALAVSDTGVDTYSDGDTGGIERRPQEMLKSHRFHALGEALRFSTIGGTSLVRRADWFPTGGTVLPR